MSKKKGFTLIELLVVISIIALLLSILMPALAKVKEQARVIVCLSHLKTLTLANVLYSNGGNGIYVPLIDDTKSQVASGQRFWNTNDNFRSLVGFDNKVTESKYVMPKEYWCPSDRRVRDENYWKTVQWVNRMSYAYNMTDWSPDSAKPYPWGNAWNDGSCRILAMKEINVKRPVSKVMFVGAQGLWANMKGAGYKKHWDIYGDDIQAYRDNPSLLSSGPVMYRHSESVSVGYYDGHTEKNKKESLFYYVDDAYDPDRNRNNSMWFASPANIAQF